MLSHFFRKLALITSASEPPTATADGWEWWLRPQTDPMEAERDRALMAWLCQTVGEETGETVKVNHQRRISRFQLQGETFYRKQLKANTPRAWARELLRPAKARLEFENAIRLQQLGIGCIPPVAWGQSRTWFHRQSEIITRAIESVTLEDYLAQLAAEPGNRPAKKLRSAIAVELGRLFAKLHQAGVSHPDPHPGNILVSQSSQSADAREFILADLHAIRFGKPLTWPESRDNLILFNRWFQLRSLAVDRALFFRAYCRSRHWFEPSSDRRAAGMELEQKTHQSNLTFWARRFPRYTGKNREFRPFQNQVGTGYAYRSPLAEQVEPLLANPERLFEAEQCQLLKDSRSAAVAVVPVSLPTGKSAVVLKWLKPKGWGYRLKSLFRPSPAYRSWVYGQSLIDRGLPTARPLVWLRRRRLWLPYDDFLAFELVPDALGLPEAVAERSRLAEPLRNRVYQGWAERLGRLIERLHHCGVSHRDLKAANILLTNSNEPLQAGPVLIDLVGVSTGQGVSLEVRQRDVARLAASFVNLPAVRHSHRLRFLLSYLSPRGEQRNWKAWWKQLEAQVGEKVRRNAERGRPLA